MIFSKTELKFCWETSFRQFQTWLLPGLRKMFTSIISNTKWCHRCWISLWFDGDLCLFIFDGRCHCHCCFTKIGWMLLPYYLPKLADVIAMCFGYFLLNNLFGCFCGQMLCPTPSVTDVVSLWHFVSQKGSKEHQKAPSPIFDHCNTSGHKVTINNFTIVGREDQNLTRAIKEALFIRVNDPSLNRNIGKYHLPHIWDEVLHTTSELKLKWPYGHSNRPPWQ